MTSLLIALVLSVGLLSLASALMPARRPSLLNRVLLRLPSQQVVRTSFSITSRAGLKQFVAKLFVSKKRLQNALFELPDILELLAMALSSGDNLYSAIKRVAPRVSGVVAEELKFALRAMDLGSELETELHEMARRLPHRQVGEFANKVSLSLRRGTPLANLLVEQAHSARAEVHNLLLKRAGQNETRMLIPLVFLILPVTVLFAIYPSLQLLNLDYI
ncbi:type II secretion system F family protein [Rhodoluna sp.]|uniref:type II secretion system F family protein n=1 Tax=Rhodoluna sp. TaxID=1969481 RepID=UPI0025D39A2F|nr:type II secretion system F family protein [Rhodoluna sp.]